ncbi:MAG: RDD family protein [Pseudomonadota bacterium]
MAPYPSITRRYFAAVLDAIVAILFVTALAKIATAFDLYGGYYWIAVFSPFCLYEPIFTGASATLGQRVFRFRVVGSRSGWAIGIPRAFVRLIVKYLLGLISLLMIPMDPQRRAIHDKAVGSVVVDSSDLMEARSSA